MSINTVSYIAFFTHIIKHRLTEMKNNITLREFDNKMENQKDREYFIKKDESNIKSDFELLKKHISKLKKHVEELED